MAQFVTINQTATGTALNITKANTAGVSVSILQNNTDNTNNVLDITNSSQSHILNLTQSGPGGMYDGSAIRVAQNSPGTAALDISVAAGAAGCCAINITHSGAQPAVAIAVNGVTPEPGIVVTQSTNADGIQVRATTTTSTVSGIDVIMNCTNGGQAIKVTQSNSGTGIRVSLPTDGADGITVSKTDTTGSLLSSGYCLSVNNSSGAIGVIVNQNKTTTDTSAAVQVTQSGQTNGVVVNKNGTGVGSGIQVGNSGTGHGILINNSRSGGGTGCGLRIEALTSNNTSSDNAALRINSTVTNASGHSCLWITDSGSGDTLKIAKTCNSTVSVGAAIELTVATTTTDSNVVAMSIDNSSSGGGHALNIQQRRTNCDYALSISSSSTNGGATILTSATGSGVRTLELNNNSTSATGNLLYINNLGTGDSIHDDSGARLTAAGSWTSISSRLTKQNLEELSTIVFQDADQNTVDIGEKIDAVKVYRFESKRVPGYKHIGIMAEDFYEAFGVGEDNKTISATDVAAVLWHEVQKLRQRMVSQQTEIDGLNIRLQALEG